MSQQDGQQPFGLAHRMALLIQANAAGNNEANNMALMPSNDAQQLLLQQELRRASAVRLQLERETQVAQAYQAGLEFACKLSQQQRQQQQTQFQQTQQSSNRIQLLDHIAGNGAAVRQSSSTPKGATALSGQTQSTPLMAGNSTSSTTTFQTTTARTESPPVPVNHAALATNAQTNLRGSTQSGSNNHLSQARSTAFNDSTTPRPAGTTASKIDSAFFLPASTNSQTVPRSSLPLVSTTDSTPASAQSSQPANGRRPSNTAGTGFSSMSNLANAWTIAPAARNGTTTATSTAIDSGRHNVSNATSTSYRATALDQWTTVMRAQSREAREVDRSSAERRSAVSPPDFAKIAFQSTNPSHGQATKTTSLPAAPPRSTNVTTGRSSGPTPTPPAPVRAPNISNAQNIKATAVPEVSAQSTTATRVASQSVVSWVDVARNIRLPDVPPGVTNPLPPIHTTDPNHLVVYVKYRIAELRRRSQRNKLESHFLNLLFDWARRAGVELPEPSEYIRLLSKVQEHRRMQQHRMYPNDTIVRVQHTSILPKAAYAPPNPPAVTMLAPVPPPVPSEIPAAMPADQTAKSASNAAIGKAKPPALALMELLRLGQVTPPKENNQSEIAISKAGASSQATTTTGGSHLPLPPPVANATPAVVQSSTETTNVNGRVRPASPTFMTANQTGVTATTVPTGAPPATEEPDFKILASTISAPKTTESTSNSVTQVASVSMVVPKESNPPKLVNDVTEVATSQSILAINEADAEPRIQESDASPTETVTKRPNQSMPTPEIDQRDTPNVNLSIEDINQPSRSESEPLAEVQDAVASISEIVEAQPAVASTSDIVVPPATSPPPREAKPELLAPAPRPKTPEDSFGVVNMRTIRSIPVNRMWVEIPVARPRPMPPRARSLSPRRFSFCLPEKIYERFDKDCKSKVLSHTLKKRTNLRLCGWDGCDAELGSEWQLEQHVRKVHVPRAKPVKRHHTEVDAWVCNWDSCNRPYASPEHLDQHLQAVHVQQGLICPYRTCLHRDTVFPNVHVLEIHIARSPILHKRENVVPLTDLSVEGPIPSDCEVPATIHRDALLPVKVFRTIWPTDRIKRNAINKVQEFSFVDRESPRMRPGESPPPMDMPMPAPVLQEEDSAADEDTIVVKSEEGTAAYTLRRTHQSDKADLVKAKTGSKPIKREMELEVVIELSRPVIRGV